MSEINSLADLRPGDLLFGPIGGLVPGVFPVGIGQLMLGEAFRAGKLSVRHVGVVVQAGWDGGHEGTWPRLVQAMPSGAEEIRMTTATHWTPRHAYVRLTEDYPGQSEDAAAIARLFVSERVPYSFLSYAALAAWRYGIKAGRLEAWINRRRKPITWEIPSHQTTSRHSIALPREAICSVLADQSWSLAGKRVMQNVAHQAVTPGAMALQLWRRNDAIWGGAGISDVAKGAQWPA